MSGLRNSVGELDCNGLIIPWGPGPYLLSDEFEIGHFEPCRSVSGPVTVTSGSASDTYQNCAGPYESPSDSGSALDRDWCD